LETHLAFLDYVKAFDRFKGHKLFEIWQCTNIPNLLLKSIIEIYSGNKKVSDKQSIIRTYNYSQK
jgi:hypothetical protein